MLTTRIEPGIGFGDFHFGMTMDVIRAENGNPVWEQWMGGNLDGDLFYHGLLLHFDVFPDEWPHGASRLWEIHIHPNREDAVLYEKLMTDWTIGALRHYLNEHGISFEEDGDDALILREEALVICFEASEQLTAIFMCAPVFSWRYWSW